MWRAVMRVSTAAGISVLMTSTVSRIEDFVERTAAEEFTEDFLRIAEHEREAAKDEVILERIVVSSTMVIAIIGFIVS